ncbi:hypothetical protein NE691_11510 [Enterococcus faecalis]|uniref:hypothetical protein n=1 Tax=Enterococcus faecalis TaxID=1351 RepID=UPI00210F1B36|nr:hypothetical protein [Enterococcus faecalis]MCQ4859155.1 hypothetical protein [Enterococcus faecalis]
MNSEDFIVKWTQHVMETDGRDNLDGTDGEWEKIHDSLQKLRMPKGQLIYRVHTGGKRKPMLSHYEDRGENQQRAFEEDYKLWVDSQD